MFRKAQQSVAHQSTLPSGFTLGNRDLRSLQEIINAEKDYIKSNARSAQDFHKASEAVKTWSASEGEDLSDCLSKLSLLFDSYATAQSRMNAHLSTVRQHFKSVRTREEALADMRARKRSLGSKIESVEKKLAKMGPENKELMKTTSQLKELRGEMESLRVEVQVEEAAIGDYKRRTAKEAMGIKCGGLLELAEKMTIIAEVGKLILEEIPLEQTHPGMPRADYLGAMRTDQLLQEATRGIADVGFTPAGSSTGMQRQGYQQHTMYPSEMDDSTQDYYNGHDESNGAADAPSGWQQERDDDGQRLHSYDNPNYDLNSSMSTSQLQQQYGAEDQKTTPIYAQHSSSSAGPSNPVPIATQDTATDEWRKSRMQATPTREAYPRAASGTPIADQFASRSPDELQVGGTGLHVVGRQKSNDSVEDAAGRSITGTGPDASAAPMSVSPGAAGVGAVGTYMTHPGANGDEAGQPPMTDDSYFQSVGSTRAAQQSVSRQPMSPGAMSSAVFASNGGSASNSAHGHMAPSSPYESPVPEGRKTTAAAFRKGFGRVSSGQPMGGSSTNLTAAASQLGGHGIPAEGDGSVGGDTAPLAIRKRYSAVPGQTLDAPTGGADDAPAPPYHHSIYGGLEGEEAYSQAVPAPPGSAPWVDQYDNASHHSRPTSAAGWRQ